MTASIDITNPAVRAARNICPWCVVAVRDDGIGGMAPASVKFTRGTTIWHQGCVADYWRSAWESQEG